MLGHVRLFCRYSRKICCRLSECCYFGAYIVLFHVVSFICCFTATYSVVLLQYCIGYCYIVALGTATLLHVFVLLHCCMLLYRRMPPDLVADLSSVLSSSKCVHYALVIIRIVCTRCCHDTVGGPSWNMLFWTRECGYHNWTISGGGWMLPFPTGTPPHTHLVQ